MPDELKALVQAAAEKSGRSLHAELLYRIQESFSDDESDRTAEMLYQMRRMQLQLETSTNYSKLLALKQEELALVGQMASNEHQTPDQVEADPARKRYAEVVQEQEKLKQRDDELLKRMFKLDDDHSDRFDLWED